MSTSENVALDQAQVFLPENIVESLHPQRLACTYQHNLRDLGVHSGCGATQTRCDAAAHRINTVAIDGKIVSVPFFGPLCSNSCAARL